MTKPSFVNIFGIPITRLDLNEIPNAAVEIIKKPGKKAFFYVNAHCLNLANRDVEYKKILQRASLVYSGGIGPVLASRFLCKPLAQRTPTPDFIEKVLDYSQNNNWSIYLVGTTDASLKTAVRKLQKQFPKLKIAGFHNGFFDVIEEKKLIADINKKKPTIVLIGMGTPKQEKWINDNKDRLNAHVFWAVGAMFDVISGSMPRAPLWSQKLGLEWLYRLYQEPRRLWRRYTLGNAVFIVSVIRQWINK